MKWIPIYVQVMTNIRQTPVEYKIVIVIIITIEIRS